MNGKLTVNRPFHVQTRRNGSKLLADGKAPTKQQGRIPRIARLLALAHHCRNLIRKGAIINQSELAHYGQISTTRMSQIMWLDNSGPRHPRRHPRSPQNGQWPRPILGERRPSNRQNARLERATQDVEFAQTSRSC